MKKLVANLKDNGRRSYCGPTALTIVTGLPYNRCEDELKAIKKKKIVRGVSSRDITMALVRLIDKKFRVAYKEFKTGNRPTLAKWLRVRTKEDRRKVFLVIITGHCLVVRGNKIYDNHHPRGVWLSKYGWRRRRVHITYHIPKEMEIAS